MSACAPIDFHDRQPIGHGWLAGVLMLVPAVEFSNDSSVNEGLRVP